MRKGLSKILITGGAGFIGSEFVRHSITRGYKIIVVDKLTYAGDLERLKAMGGKYKFYKTDIRDIKKPESIFKKEKPQILVHFAAETHVDRSIQDASIFLETNVLGTKNMLDLSRKYGVKKFIHISTDEVYGEIKKGRFSEGHPLQPNSPYAASKAAADLLIKSYIRTYGFPAIIVRPCNNYGPWQYPEKFIPVIIYKTINDKRLPVYGRGLNIREWLHVSDCAAGIMTVMIKGRIGEIYNLGSGRESRNIDIAEKIIEILDKPRSLIEFVRDRPGHDFRYSLDSRKIRQLGWLPKADFETGISQTVNWYKENLNWLEFKVRRLNPNYINF